MKKVTLGRTEPVAYVTKGKHRLKQYTTDTVYLRNGDEFELELFNPTQDKVMAKVELNGNSLGAGIVLRPGERVFVERYLDEARKFAFSTYEVNGKNEEVKKAIANNGDVRVLFYKETVNYNYPVHTTWTTSWPTWGDRTFTDTPVYGSGEYTRGIVGDLSGSHEFNSMSNTLDGPSAMGAAMFSSSLGENEGKACLDGTLDFAPQSMKRSGRPMGRKLSKSVKSKSVETGRIDKGSHSGQSFGHDYSTFDTYWTWETTWKILPVSQKPLVSADIKVFCTSCGTRQKKSSHKFCPNCGTKF